MVCGALGLPIYLGGLQGAAVTAVEAAALLVYWAWQGVTADRYARYAQQHDDAELRAHLFGNQHPDDKETHQ
jgi:hypothetical protein